MQTLHGVALNIFDCGVMITGPSGIGKSELGLELVARGHQLIADDAINICKTNRQLLLNNPSNKFYMHIRDIGFINIEQQFNNICKSHKLDLVIKLITNNPLIENPLKQNITEITIADEVCQCFELCIGNKRPLALLVEIIVKNHLTLHNSHTVFIQEHDEQLQRTAICN